MKEEIIKILDTLEDKFNLSIDWTSQNIISYLEKLSTKIINYELVTSYIWLIFASLICVVSIIFFKIERKYWWKDKRRNGMQGVGLVCGIFCFIIFIVITSCEINDIISCHVFPEKVILEFIKSKGLLN